MQYRLAPFVVANFVWHPQPPCPQPDLILSERDLARTVRCSYLSPAFRKLPSFLGEEPPITLDRVAAHLTYNQQVKVDEKKQQGDQKYRWLEQHIGVEELFAERCILVDKG